MRPVVEGAFQAQVWHIVRPLRPALRARHLRRWGRIAALSLLIAACSKGADGQVAPKGDGAGVKPEDHVACALIGAKDFADSCTFERGTQDGAATLLIRHPDGGFRRFELKNGALATADGADAAQIGQAGSVVEVAVGKDRYRIPAAALGNAKP